MALLSRQSNGNGLPRNGTHSNRKYTRFLHWVVLIAEIIGAIAVLCSVAAGIRWYVQRPILVYDVRPVFCATDTGERCATIINKGGSPAKNVEVQFAPLGQIIGKIEHSGNLTPGEFHISDDRRSVIVKTAWWGKDKTLHVQCHIKPHSTSIPPRITISSGSDPNIGLSIEQLLNTSRRAFILFFVAAITVTLVCFFLVVSIVAKRKLQRYFLEFQQQYDELKAEIERVRQASLSPNQYMVALTGLLFSANELVQRVAIRLAEQQLPEHILKDLNYFSQRVYDSSLMHLGEFFMGNGTNIAACIFRVKTKKLWVRAWSPNMLDGVGSYTKDWLHGIEGKAISSGVRQVTENVAADPDIFSHNSCCPFNEQAVIAVPVVTRGGKTVGCLALYFNQPISFHADSEEAVFLDLVTELFCLAASFDPDWAGRCSRKRLEGREVPHS